MKGIVLAGGLGTRLRPLTWMMSKQLLPIYDKPMIYYPLATLMEAGIRDVLFISTPEDLPRIEQLLGCGKRFGMSFSYLEQKEPKGIAEAFLIGEAFLEEGPVTLILGDNLFYSEGLANALEEARIKEQGATIFGYKVADPHRFGVLELDAQGRVTGIIEKPIQPPSNYAVTGLYCYDSSIVAKAKSLTPSPRGELEITDINKLYLQENTLTASILDEKEAFWLDAGTSDTLYKAGQFVREKEIELGQKLGCIEQTAYCKRFISKSQFQELTHLYGDNAYGQYLMSQLKL
tara:strand:+ start:1101 stop:1970 length:870 start_codon:yes stop_codon:yes gene_type:complete